MAKKRYTDEERIEKRIDDLCHLLAYGCYNASGVLGKLGKVVEIVNLVEKKERLHDLVRQIQGQVYDAAS